jgi:hypothetical protein
MEQNILTSESTSAKITFRGKPQPKRRIQMRLSKTLCTTIVAMAIFIAVSAAAKSKDYRTVLLHYDATVAGSHLASGDYNVQWENHNPAATISFLHGSKVVATVEGEVVDHGTKYRSNEVVYSAGANGARAIQEIRFRGLSEVIEFE